jgi:uncharacterized RDD family membrane protein YckC
MNEKHIKAWLWRRIAATWIDSFVIYAISAFLITWAEIIRLRISIEPLYVFLFAVYATALLTWRGQTIGKMLMGISVSIKASYRLSLRIVLVREVLGKWGITVVIPILLGRRLMGLAIYDILIILLMLLLLLVYYLITKQTWYDRLAGTNVERVAAHGVSIRFALVTLIVAAVLVLGTKAMEFKIQDRIPCRLSIYNSMRFTKPYTTFLKQGQETPVDYVIGLFEQYDVVVLSERTHPEGSQWEFIYDIVQDPRFVERVGHVFTEYGQVGMQSYLDDFMATDGLDTREIQTKIIHIMRDFPVWPTWTNTNFYMYLMRLYSLNQSLPGNRRIQQHFTDMPANWLELTTADEYQAYIGSLKNRDEQMAQTVIEKMRQLSESESTQPKCLVIMNYRHGFDLTGGSLKVKRINTYEFLKDAFRNRAANVLLNTHIFSVPLVRGLWDTAFEETGNQPAGFDFAGSPFGKDTFDMFPIIPTIRGNLKYQDVFTGFVYVNPLNDQYKQHGIPGYFEGFEEEALRRSSLVSEDNLRTVKYFIYREKRGEVPWKEELPWHKIETLLELFLLGLNSVGLIIGGGAIALDWGLAMCKRRK